MDHNDERDFAEEQANEANALSDAFSELEAEAAEDALAEFENELGGFDGVIVRFGDGTDGDTWDTVFGVLSQHGFTLKLTFRTRRDDGIHVEDFDAKVRDWNVTNGHGLYAVVEVLFDVVGEDGETVTVPLLLRPLDTLVGIEVY